MSNSYQISDESLALRRQFLRLDKRDIAVLSRLAPWADRVAGTIAREFYDHQFAFAPTIEFFEHYAAAQGITTAQLRVRLETAQAGYFREIFAEARQGGEFGLAYFARRMDVGELHNVINLPLKWYVGSYPLYQDLVRRHLGRGLLLRPWLRSRAERAIFTVFNFDLQAVTDAFFYDYLRAIGLNLESIHVDRPTQDLSDHYEELKSAVRNTLEETARTSQALIDVGARLRETADRTENGANQIALAIGQVAAGAQDQAQAATTTSRAVAGLGEVIGQVRASAGDTTTRVGDASTAVASLASAIDDVSAASGEVGRVSAAAAVAADHGADAVRLTSGGMDRIRRAVSESSERVAELGARSQKIGAIVETINDIADQTNLLALNAAIEAARAGEQGKGFAVVADEVRKLAERSGRATKEIAALIAEVQSVTQAAVAAMETGAREVEAGSELTERSGQALSEIASSVEATTAAVGRIGASVDSMTQASGTVVESMDRIERLARENSLGADRMASQSGDVSSSVDSIAAVSQENSAASEEVSAATVEMSGLAREVVTSATNLAEMAATLGGLMARFNLDVSDTDAAGPAKHAVRPMGHPAGIRRPRAA